MSLTAEMTRVVVIVVVGVAVAVVVVLHLHWSNRVYLWYLAQPAAFQHQPIAGRKPQYLPFFKERELGSICTSRTSKVLGAAAKSVAPVAVYRTPLPKALNNADLMQDQ